MSARTDNSDARLLRALAEQLKLPLLQIARTAEFAHETGDVTSLTNINYIAEAALRLVDGFLLSSQNQQTLALEPVSVSSVLNDTAHKLAPLAKLHGCDIELSLHGRYGPVMANKQSLESAFALLGYSLLEARTSDNRRHRIVLAAHKGSGGLVAGVFDNQPGLSADMLRRGKALYGTARQTLPAASAANGAGVFVADALFQGMQSHLHVARHDKHTGLAATLLPSQQEQLIKMS